VGAIADDADDAGNATDRRAVAWRGAGPRHAACGRVCGPCYDSSDADSCTRHPSCDIDIDINIDVAIGQPGCRHAG
jgi:hypothetical protein